MGIYLNPQGSIQKTFTAYITLTPGSKAKWNDFSSHYRIGLGLTMWQLFKQLGFFGMIELLCVMQKKNCSKITCLNKLENFHIFSAVIFSCAAKCTISTHLHIRLNCDLIKVCFCFSFICFCINYIRLKCFLVQKNNKIQK